MICYFCMVSSRSALPENHELPRRGATLGSAGYAGDGDGEIAGESELSPIGIESRSALTAVTWDHMGQGPAFNFFGSSGHRCNCPWSFGGLEREQFVSIFSGQATVRWPCR